MIKIDWNKTTEKFNYHAGSRGISNSLVVAVCPDCQKDFEIILRSAKRRLFPQCHECINAMRKEFSTKLQIDCSSDLEYKKKHKSQCNTNEFRAKQSKKANQLWIDQRDKLIKIQNALHSDKAYLTKLSIAVRNAYKDPIKKSRIKEGQQATSNRQRLSQAQTDNWNTESYRQRLLDVFKKRPNPWDITEYRDKLSIISDQNRLGIDEFVSRSTKVHGSTYDYSKSEYLTTKNPTTIICRTHGEFKQIPEVHWLGGGCPECSKTISSQHQQIINHISSLYVGDILVNDRKLIKPLELDIVISSLKLAIEYNGNLFHSYNHPETILEKTRHQHKHIECVKQGIQLLQITEDEWRHKSDIIKSMINAHLGVATKVYARECEIEIVNQSRQHLFFQENHIQGGRYSKLALGLFHNGELSACMSFSPYDTGWEIIRFANKLNSVVVGGASRLFKSFIKTNNPSSILSYADARFSIGKLYAKLGFTLVEMTKPNYKYLDKGNYLKVHSRQHFQKHKLPDLLPNFDPMISESNNMFKNGYRRLWDAGNYKFMWPS